MSLGRQNSERHDCSNTYFIYEYSLGWGWGGVGVYVEPMAELETKNSKNIYIIARGGATRLYESGRTQIFLVQTLYLF